MTGHEQYIELTERNAHCDSRRVLLCTRCHMAGAVSRPALPAEQEDMQKLQLTRVSRWESISSKAYYHVGKQAIANAIRATTALGSFDYVTAQS